MSSRYLLIDVTEVGLIKTEAFIQQLSWAKLPFTDINAESGVVVRTVKELEPLADYLEVKCDELEEEENRLLKLVDKAFAESNFEAEAVMLEEASVVAKKLKELQAMTWLLSPEEEY